MIATSARAKIVCTLGPSSRTYEVISALAQAGMDVARLNFSHGTHAEHTEVIEHLRQISADLGKPLGIMLDLQGPKVRVEELEGGEIKLEKGQRFVITSQKITGTAQKASCTYRGLYRDVGPGEVILLDDGMLSLRVDAVEGKDIICEVVDGGVLKNHKGINVPGVPLSVPTISRKDIADTLFGLKNGVDFLAMSFVRRASDVLQMRRFLDKHNSTLPIITKVEKPQAMDHIDEIIEVSQGIMVARGDLGVEMSPEKVPGLQKMMIRKCNTKGVPVITATQMLDSMINNPRPTRAEASDVANAILDGSDAVMLSAESASGNYPVEAVSVMQRIIIQTETDPLSTTSALDPTFTLSKTQVLALNQGIARSTCSLAEQVGASAIVSITLSGNMACEIARYRPRQPVFALTQHEAVARHLTVYWGVQVLPMGDLNNSHLDDALAEIEEALKTRGRLNSGDLYVITAGMPFTARRMTNMVRIERIS